MSEKNLVLERKRRAKLDTEWKALRKKLTKEKLAARACLEQTRECIEVWQIVVDAPEISDAQIHELESFIKEVLAFEWGSASVEFDRGFKSALITHEDGRKISL